MAGKNCRIQESCSNSATAGAPTARRLPGTFGAHWNCRCRIDRNDKTRMTQAERNPNNEVRRWRQSRLRFDSVFGIGHSEFFHQPTCRIQSLILWLIAFPIIALRVPAAQVFDAAPSAL